MYSAILNLFNLAALLLFLLSTCTIKYVNECSHFMVSLVNLDNLCLYEYYEYNIRTIPV